MAYYSVQHSDQIYVKGYGIFPFAKKTSKNFDKNINKNLTSKYSQKLVDHAKQLATDTLKTILKEAIQKQQKQLVV